MTKAKNESPEQRAARLARDRAGVDRYQRSAKGIETNRLRKRAKNGFTAELIASLREQQGGLCGMPGCGVKLVVGGTGRDGECADHDHVTGKARGLLCKRCNTQLGAWEALERDGSARAYLVRFC